LSRIETDSFHAYSSNPDDAQSISHDAFNPSLQTILEDRTGNLWVGTQNGLNRYDKEQQRFQQFLHVPDDSASLDSSNIFSIYADRQGVLWVGTDKGLNCYDEKKLLHHTTYCIYFALDLQGATLYPSLWKKQVLIFVSLVGHLSSGAHKSSYLPAKPSTPAGPGEVLAPDDIIRLIGRWCGRE
jgi:hypothetical protein